MGQRLKSEQGKSCIPWPSFDLSVFPPKEIRRAKVILGLEDAVEAWGFGKSSKETYSRKHVSAETSEVRANAHICKRTITFSRSESIESILKCLRNSTKSGKYETKLGVCRTGTFVSPDTIPAITSATPVSRVMSGIRRALQNREIPILY